MGDFNCVLYYGDKINGNPLTHVETRDFEHCLANSILIWVRSRVVDICFLGAKRDREIIECVPGLIGLLLVTLTGTQCLQMQWWML